MEDNGKPLQRTLGEQTHRVPVILKNKFLRVCWGFLIGSILATINTLQTLAWSLSAYRWIRVKSTEELQTPGKGSIKSATGPGWERPV